MASVNYAGSLTGGAAGQPRLTPPGPLAKLWGGDVRGRELSRRGSGTGELALPYQPSVLDETTGMGLSSRQHPARSRPRCTLRACHWGAHVRTALLPLLAALALLLALTPAAASAAPFPGTVSLDQGAFVAHENQGELQITIVRSNPQGEENVGYGVHSQDAVRGQDFDVVENHNIHMASGQRTYTFSVRIYDNGMNAPPIHALAYLYGAWPQTAADPHEAQITILRDDPIEPRDSTNPLALASRAANGNPLSGVRFHVAGSESSASQAAASYRNSNPAWASALQVLANAPSTRRFWFWNEPDPTSLVADYLEGTQHDQPGTTVQLSTYSLVHGRCGETTSPAFVARYRDWIDKLATGIGNFHVVMFFEVDSLITAGCLSAHDRHVRLVDELAWAVNRIEQDPHLVLYLDGGAADAVPWQTTARWLDQAAVHKAQGFFLNSTHFDWTSSELNYGQQIAKRLGGVHFVVDTHGGGRGPLVPPDRVHQGNEVLCNPPGRGLGPLTTNTHYTWADAFVWGTGTVGNSGGACRPGAPPTATFWPRYAVMLVKNAVNRVTGPRYPLIREG
jgi:endoglucanase